MAYSYEKYAASIGQYCVTCVIQCSQSQIRGTILLNAKQLPPPKNLSEILESRSTITHISFV